MSLHQKIKAARLRLGITQAEASAVCGVSPRAYWQWEAGKSTLDVTLEGALRRLRKKKKIARGLSDNQKRLDLHEFARWIAGRDRHGEIVKRGRITVNFEIEINDLGDNEDVVADMLIHEWRQSLKQ